MSVKRTYIRKVLIPLFYSFSLIFYTNPGAAQLLTREDLNYLEDLTHAVIDSSRVLPDAELPQAIRGFGPNRTGISLIRPGGRDCYPAFWIRDYAMSLETGYIPKEEQYDILIFTAERQADQSWISKGGSLIPAGAIPDHIRFNDGLPVYFPGTYSYEDQGHPMWRIPPYCDQFFFIHMAFTYIQSSGDEGILGQLIGSKTLLQRLESAYKMVPENPLTKMVCINPAFPTCDFGFRDVIGMTGDICFGSILKYQAALQLSVLFGMAGWTGEAGIYRAEASRIRENLPGLFFQEDGLLRATTRRSDQPDVWATAYAVCSGILNEPEMERASRALAREYVAGTIACEGQIRHVPTNADYSETTMWETAAAALNTYQNGAYWATATGWVCQAISLTNPSAARKLASEYIQHLRKTDFRQGPDFGGPYECIFPATNHRQNAVYMTSVTVPLNSFRRIIMNSER